MRKPEVVVSRVIAINWLLYSFQWVSVNLFCILTEVQVFFMVLIAFDSEFFATCNSAFFKI